MFLALFALLQLLTVPFAAAAQEGIGSRTLTTVSWVEEWDPALGEWVRIEESEAVSSADQVGHSNQDRAQFSGTHEASRFAQPYRDAIRLGAIARYGPFLVLDEDRAALIGSTSETTPAQFDAMLRDYPGIAVLEMIEAPGTTNDIANLEVGRRIRETGIATHVPSDGSVRSGAVELFLAGVEKTIEPGAYFAVHSWLDNYGRQPRDFAPDAPENRLYIDFYVEMGMTERKAREFYAMTNSVPHEDALWLRAEEMAFWIAPVPPTVPTSAAIASVELVIPTLALPSVELVPVASMHSGSAPLPAIAYAEVAAWPGTFAS